MINTPTTRLYLFIYSYNIQQMSSYMELKCLSNWIERWSGNPVFLHGTWESSHCTSWMKMRH